MDDAVSKGLNFYFPVLLRSFAFVVPLSPDAIPQNSHLFTHFLETFPLTHSVYIPTLPHHPASVCFLSLASLTFNVTYILLIYMLNVCLPPLECLCPDGKGFCLFLIAISLAPTRVWYVKATHSNFIE